MTKLNQTYKEGNMSTLKRFLLGLAILTFCVFLAQPAFAGDIKCAFADGRSSDVWIPMSDFIKGGMDPLNPDRPIYAAAEENNYLRFGENVSQTTIEKIKEKYRINAVKVVDNTMYLVAQNMRGKRFHPIQSLPGRKGSLKETDRFYLKMEDVYKGNEGCTNSKPTMMYFISNPD